MKVDLSIDNVAVFLNNKLIKTAFAADDIEGWVEIPDFFTAAPLIPGTKVSLDQPKELKEFPTKKLYGEVRIVRLREVEKTH
jgi:hypothetical protein